MLYKFTLSLIGTKYILMWHSSIYSNVYAYHQGLTNNNRKWYCEHYAALYLMHHHIDSNKDISLSGLLLLFVLFYTFRKFILSNKSKHLNRFWINQFKPVSTFTALGFTFVKPHPVDGSGIFFTDASYNTVVCNWGNNIWFILGSCNSFVDLHLIWILLIWQNISQSLYTYIEQYTKFLTHTSRPACLARISRFSIPVACSIGSFMATIKTTTI